MVRPNKKRKIIFAPEVVYYKPAGVPLRNLKEINLNLDELEAIRLCDYKGLKQEEAADKMKVSQSTLFRILKKGRKKISRALIEGKAIKVKVK